MHTQAMFSEEEQKRLKQISRGMIPPAPAEALPGADDEQIFEY